MTVAVCIASGPSLTREDVEYCRGKAKIYVVNTCYQLAPWADVLYACDFGWWDAYRPEFEGEKWTIDHQASAKFGLNKIGFDPETQWSNQKNCIATGNNGRHSGFQVLNLAVIQGASKVILLGYDMKARADGVLHWHADHPARIRKHPMPADFKRWAALFDNAKPLIGIPVINCTRDSAIECFPKMALRAAL